MEVNSSIAVRFSEVSDSLDYPYPYVLDLKTGEIIYNMSPKNKLLSQYLDIDIMPRDDISFHEFDAVGFDLFQITDYRGVVTKNILLEVAKLAKKHLRKARDISILYEFGFQALDGTDCNGEFWNEYVFVAMVTGKKYITKSIEEL